MSRPRPKLTRLPSYAFRERSFADRFGNELEVPKALEVGSSSPGSRAPRASMRAEDGAEFAEHLDPLLIPGVPPAGVRRLSKNIAEHGLVNNMKGYPRSVFFILGNEFCERFSFYGMKAILTLYFITEHHLESHIATLIYHAFTSVAYITPLLGSLLADSYFGRFKVILYLSIVYVIGHGLLSFGAIPYLSYAVRSFFDFAGLLVIAIGTGGIKPCVSAFAADQFDSSQSSLRAQFFSFFYFAINAGSLFAIFLTPILRSRVKCFGSDHCFPLAFGVPGVLMGVSLLFFLAGWPFYKRVPPRKENLVGNVTCCIWTAARRKFAAVLGREKERPEHWLDYAAPTHSRELIDGVKRLVSIAVLYGPLVFFWALSDQQGSTWVIQARRLDGRVGPFTILPEQMNVINPLLILIMVPLFEGVIYPMMVNVTPLRKMALGGLLAALSFVIAGLLQFEIDPTMEPHPSSGHVFVRRLGNFSQPISLNQIGSDIHTEVFHLFAISSLKLYSEKIEVPAGEYWAVVGGQNFTLNLTIPNTDKQSEGQAYVVGIYDHGPKGVKLTQFEYTTEKVEGSRILVAVAPDSDFEAGSIYVIDHYGEAISHTAIRTGELLVIKPPFWSYPDYILRWGSNENCSVDPAVCSHELPFKSQMGSKYIIDLRDNHQQSPELVEIVRPNSINIAWMLPQYIVIGLGEVLLSVTGLEFSYSQSAPNMKSVLQALWLMTVFLGNLIDMGISGSHIVPSPALEFFVYALLTAFVIGIFIILAMRYTYVDEGEEDDEEGALEAEKRPVESLRAPKAMDDTSF